jgi:hypothetical protein
VPPEQRAAASSILYFFQPSALVMIE